MNFDESFQVTLIKETGALVEVNEPQENLINFISGSQTDLNLDVSFEVIALEGTIAFVEVMKSQENLTNFFNSD